MKNFIKNKKGNKILLGLATASVLTVPAIVAVSCADPVKGTIKNVNYDVDTDKKEIKLIVTGENLTKDKKDWKITYQSKAQLKADETKEIREFEIKEDEANKKYTLSFDYGKNPELDKNGVIYTVSHRGGKGVLTSEVYVTPEISEVKATVSADDNKTVTLVVTGGMLSGTKTEWKVWKIDPKAKEGETEGTPVGDDNITIKEDTAKTKYTLAIKNQDGLKEGTKYKVKYGSSEKVSNSIELNPKIEKVELDLNSSVKNVKLTVTGTKLNKEDSSAYTVKRIEVGSDVGRKKEAKDDIIKNVAIDESSTPTNVILKFNDKELAAGKSYKYSVQIGESKVETEVEEFKKETKINEIDISGAIKEQKEVTLTVKGTDLPTNKEVYKVVAWKDINDGTGQGHLEDVTLEVLDVPSEAEVKIKVTHTNALAAGKYMYKVIIDGAELDNSSKESEVAA